MIKSMRVKFLLKTESRSDPDSKQKQKQGLYQSHSMCEICDGHKMSQF